MNKGYIQVYTGNGKGKTTAALGLSLRAVSAGLKVYFGQFIKGMKYSELEAVHFLPGFTMEQFGRNCFIRNNPTDEDISLARDGFEKWKRAILSGEYDVVVADEMNVALKYQLFSLEEVLQVLANKPEHVEAVITGRHADPRLIDVADLVTEMKEIKHYYQQGVRARKGIES